MAHGQEHATLDGSLILQSLFSCLAGYEDPNEVLQREIEPLLTRPVGRSANAPVVWYAGFLHQAQSWDLAQ